MRIHDIPEVEELLKAGKTRKEIADVFGTSPATVKAFIREYMPAWKGYSSTTNRKVRQKERLSEMRSKLRGERNHPR